MALSKLLAIKDYMEVEIQEHEIPEPQEDGLVIKVEAAAICGSDLMFMAEKNQQREYAGNLGHEFCGRIVAMGEKARENIYCFGGELNIGDKIAIYPWITCEHCPGCLKYGHGICNACEHAWIYGGMDMEENEYLNHNPNKWPYFKGGFGEYVYVFPKTYVWKVPEDMPSKVAALLDPCAVAMRAVEQAMTSVNALHEGVNVLSSALVIGPGPIGLLTAMILRQMGVNKVIISGRNDRKLKRAKELTKADVTLNMRGLSVEEKIEKVKEVTDGMGADLVFNCASSADACLEGMQMVSFLGTYVEVGMAGCMDPEQKLSFNVPNVVFDQNATITSVVANSPKTYDRAFNILKRKDLPFEQLITHEFHSLDEFVETIKHGHDEDYIKGVLVFEE